MKYVCSICGFVFDEEAEGRPFSELDKCPVCQQPASVFVPEDDQGQTAAPQQAANIPDIEPAGDLAYDPAFVRHDPKARYMAQIHEMAVTGESIFMLQWELCSHFRNGKISCCSVRSLIRHR